MQKISKKEVFTSREDYLRVLFASKTGNLGCSSNIQTKAGLNSTFLLSGAVHRAAQCGSMQVLSLRVKSSSVIIGIKIIQ